MAVAAWAVVRALHLHLVPQNRNTAPVCTVTYLEGIKVCGTAVFLQLYDRTVHVIASSTSVSFTLYVSFTSSTSVFTSRTRPVMHLASTSVSMTSIVHVLQGLGLAIAI